MEIEHWVCSWSPSGRSLYCVQRISKLTHVGIWIPWWPFVCSTVFQFLTIGQCQHHKWECQSALFAIFAAFLVKLQERLYLSLMYKMKGHLGNEVSNTFHGPNSRSDLFFVSFSMWQFQLSLSSIVTPSDLELRPVTLEHQSLWLIGKQ